jgi:HSP20 family protein
MRLIPYREHLVPPVGFAPLRDSMNRLFDEFFAEESGIEPRAHTFWPAFDVFELPEDLMVVADLPGIEAKDIRISFNDNTLIIEGERVRKEAKYEGWYRQERPFGKFTRTIRLPVKVDENNVEALDKAGVLTIRLHKLEAAKTKKIPVKLA